MGLGVSVGLKLSPASFFSHTRDSAPALSRAGIKALRVRGSTKVTPAVKPPKMAGDLEMHWQRA